MQNNLESWQNRSAKLQTLTLSLLLFVFVVVLALILKSIVKLFLFGLLINYLLTKPVNFLTRYLRIRAISIFLSFVMIIGFFVAVINLLFPIFQEQSTSLMSSLSELRIEINSKVYGFEDLQVLIENNFAINNFYDLFSGSLTKSINLITELVLTLIISFYLLLDGERLWQLFASLFPVHYLEHLTEIKKRIDANLSALVIGQFKIAILTATVMLFTYLFLANEFAVLLGALQMLEFIPILGTWTAIIPSITLVFASGGQDQAIIAGSIYLIYTQIIRDHIIAPRIMGSAFGVHPLVIVFGLLIGIQVFGLIGVVVSLPIIAIASAIVDYLLKFKDTSDL